MAQTCLPPGFRFHPTDVELVSYYLKRKIMGKKLIVQAISEVELYKFAPWDLPDKSCLRSKDLEWFFFCPRDKKYPNGSRTNRATPNGYWKTSGKDRIIELNSRLVGSKKTLIFHEGKAPKGNRTDWVMYEYKMEDDQLVSAGFSKDAYVLCKIFKKSGLGPRIGEQYGAPFNENEWDIPDADTSMFPLMPSSEVVNSTGATHVQPAVTLGAIEEPHPHVHHLSVASAEIEISENTTAATVDDLGYITAECAPQELPSEQPVESTQDDRLISVNDGSIEATNACSPLVDGILLDELSMFLNGSPRHGTPVGEYSGLPPMSEAEAHAFDVNNYDLYNEIAGLAELGVPGGDDFCATNVCGPESTFQPISSVFNSDDDPNYLDMDELFDPAPSANLYQLPVPDNHFLQYPWDQSTYYGDYHGSSALSAASASSDSLPTMPNVVDDFPAVANKDGLARDPSLQYPLP